MNRAQTLDNIIVTAAEMRQIEARIFAGGMPVVALMEKAAGLVARRIEQVYSLTKYPRVGFFVGPGHNGGDGLVVARELHLAGYHVEIYCPFTELKELTAIHAQYARSLGISFVSTMDRLQGCDLIVDGLFGFGLTRSQTGEIATAIATLNQWQQPVVSIDVPSGIGTDTGEILGIAVKASHSLCLGLWKRCFFQDSALDYLGRVERIDFGIPVQDVWAVVSEPAPVQAMTAAIAKKQLPLPRPLVTHKYQRGHLLLICGSRRYGGGAILTGLGARASGVGMLSIAVPASLKALLLNHLPDALIIDCPETETGAIANLSPLATDFSQYDAIACGPGLTLDTLNIVQNVLTAPCPLLLDADALNLLAQLLAQGGTVTTLRSRPAPTVLTPHLGEFKRLFPEIIADDRLEAVKAAAQVSQAVVLLKGAKTAIANPQGSLRLIADSTPALARGGSGDVLTGLIGGLMAQSGHLSSDLPENLLETVATAAYWHAQAGILAAADRTDLGVDAHTLTTYLNPALGRISSTIAILNDS